MANKNSRITSLHGVAAALALTAGACDWTAFDDLADEASVHTIDAPGSYRRSGFGSVVATFHGKVGKSQVSRLLASAGADSPILVERLWDGKKLASGSTVRCKDKNACKKGLSAGSVLVPFETWARGTSQEQHGCFYTPGDPNGYVFCETNSGSNPTFKLGLTDLKPKASALQFSGAALPPEHPLGIALVGVYAVSTRSKEPSLGALYYQPDLVKDAPPLRRLAVIDPHTQAPFSDADDAADLGFAVASATNNQGELVIAFSQPSKNRVIVATFDDNLKVPAAITDPIGILNAKVRTRACIESPSSSVSGFGKRLAMGDINGDDEPELFMGIDPLDGENDGKRGLWMVRGADLPDYDETRDSCAGWDSDAVEVKCEDGIHGAKCKDSAFGASLAIGDVDGDHLGDLLVGAPRADVTGAKDGGTVWIIPGSDDHKETGGLDLEGATNLYASSFEAKGYVGTSVAALHTADRDEPMAGAPGSETVYMFLCSPLETGVSKKNLCLPK